MTEDEKKYDAMIRACNISKEALIETGHKTDYANQKVKSRYCPNCGAIMDLNGE